MFTGLIQCVGQIANISQQGNEAQLRISADFESYQLGESIAVNGACLSVTSFTDGQFTVFASSETLAITGLTKRPKGARVNLEKALTLQTPLGGHLVTGHVDTRVSLLAKQVDKSAALYRFSLPLQTDLKYQIAPKGSATIDGVSLTVNRVLEENFEVMIIPITLAHTTLGELSLGTLVNLETDVLAKYIARKIDGEQATPKSADISVDVLTRNGFMR